MLGVKSTIGRLIVPEDDRRGAESAVAVVSWSYWKSRFNLDPSVLGKRVFVDDAPVTIVGVAPHDFSGLQTGLRPEVWLALAMEPVIHRPSRIGGGGLALLGD